MPNVNKIHLIGHLGHDPELRTSGAGNAFTNFRIAETENKKGKGGEWEKVTTWFSCTAFGKSAEWLCESASKGDPVYVEGTVGLDEWTSNDGTPRSSISVTCSRAVSLAPRVPRQSTDGDMPF